MTISTLFLDHINFLVRFRDFLFLFHGNFIVSGFRFQLFFLFLLMRNRWSLTNVGLGGWFRTFLKNRVWEKIIFSWRLILNEYNIGGCFDLIKVLIIIEIDGIVEESHEEIRIYEIGIRLIDHFELEYSVLERNILLL